MTDYFKTFVAGITKKNYNGEKIQTILKDYVKENYDSNRFDKEDYDYRSNEEIALEDKEIYQYELEEEGSITLIPEPDNPYDSNAIIVCHKEMGMIGYIPKRDNVRLDKYINDNDSLVKINMKLRGGPYKYFDEFTESVRKSTGPYYIRLYIIPLGDGSDIHDNVSIVKKSSYKLECKTIAKNPYDYDIFEWLSLSDYNGNDENLLKENTKEIININKDDNIADNKDNKLKKPIIHLYFGILSLILVIPLIVTKNYILSIISFTMCIKLIIKYIDYNNK